MTNDLFYLKYRSGESRSSYDGLNHTFKANLLSALNKVERKLLTADRVKVAAEILIFKRKLVPQIANKVCVLNYFVLHLDSQQYAVQTKTFIHRI